MRCLFSQKHRVPAAILMRYYYDRELRSKRFTWLAQAFYLLKKDPSGAPKQIPDDHPAQPALAGCPETERSISGRLNAPEHGLFKQ